MALSQAGRSITLASELSVEPLPERLLATAYDSKWRLKKVIPKDAFPTSRSPSPKTKTPSPKPKPRPKVTASHLDTSIDIEPISPFSPGGTQLSPKSFNEKRKKRKEQREKEKLFSEEDLERDGSEEGAEDSDDKGKKPTGKQKIAAMLVEEDDGREEKPFSVWAKEAEVPEDLAKQALDHFLENMSMPCNNPQYAVDREKILFNHPFDARTDIGYMNTEDFGKACLEIAELEDFSTFPEGFLESAMKTADKDGSGTIDFWEFLYFYYKFSFSEEVLISPKEREIRAAAREHDIPYDEIGKYWTLYKQTDQDGNGTIEYDEFKAMLFKLLKCGDEGVPEKRIMEFWKDASRGTGGREIDFIAFVGWYKTNFSGGRAGTKQESPIEAYYHNVRRVVVYDSSEWH